MFLQVKSIVEWRDFYSRSYTFVGKLVGRYYDSQGNPTKYLKGAEAKAARGAQLLEKQKKEEAKQPSCNSRWSQNEGGEVYVCINFKSRKKFEINLQTQTGNPPTTSFPFFFPQSPTHEPARYGNPQDQEIQSRAKK
ncbi:hypothetical protein L484_004564 [Morus notabilis]|uniref:Uncharacterized protein n=1 Tax=Morus notabilis TaxID=981085 RepID=W9SGC1_9ROSA|nr:hypothetical protein L484_004564 [Morus notabilis]